MQQAAKTRIFLFKMSFYLFMSNAKIAQLRRKRKGQTVNR